MHAHRRDYSRPLHLALACIIVVFLVAGPAAPAAAAPLAASAAGATPFQQSLQAALAARTAAGLPTPKVAYAVSVTPPAAGATVQVTGQTTIEFGGPAAAGYARWPSFTVDGRLPTGARGRAAAGSYDGQIQAAVAAAFPGAWDQYDYGSEPRTYIVTETVTRTLARSASAAATPLGTHDAPVAGQVVLGFTVRGPDLDYSIAGAWQIFGVTVAEARAGLALGWGAGLRLPLGAALTVPVALEPAQEYTATTSLAGLDWSPADYTAAELAPEDGSEFVLRYAFVVSAWAKILGATVVDWSLADLRFDASRSFATPFGGRDTFPIPALDLGPDATGLHWDLFSVLSLGVGFVVDPAIASDKITAAWQAGAQRGTLTYAAPGAAVTFGPFHAVDFAPGVPAVVQMTDFRYWFTHFLLKLGGYLQFDLFGYGTRSGTFSIVQLDLHDLTGGLYLPVHAGTAGVVAAIANRGPDCTAAAPTVARLWPVDNRLVPVGVQGVTDPDDAAAPAAAALAITVTAIGQDEPVDDPIDGQAGAPVGDYFGPDGRGVGTPTAWLRAQSAPGGNGRIYHVAYLAADAAGAGCTGVVAVGVPKPDAGDTPPVDGGTLYDATAASVRPLFITLVRK